MASYSTVLGKWSKLNSALPGFKSPPHVSCVDSLYFFSFYEVHFSMAKLLKSTEFTECGACGRENGDEQLPVTVATFFCPHRSHSLLLANKSHTAEWPQSLPSGSSAEEWSRIYIYIFNFWKAARGKQVVDKSEPFQTSCYEMPSLHFSTLSLFLFANPA